MQYGRVTISVVNVELTHRDDCVAIEKVTAQLAPHTGKTRYSYHCSCSALEITLYFFTDVHWA